MDRGDEQVEDSGLGKSVEKLFQMMAWLHEGDIIRNSPKQGFTIDNTCT